MTDDLKGRMEQAIQQAKDSPEGHLLRIAARYFPGLKPNGYLKVCPFCQNKEQKFRVYRTGGGHFTWGCFRTDCRASFGSQDVKHDAIGLVAEMEGLDWKAARDRFLDIAGVPNPMREHEEEKRRRSSEQPKKPSAPPPADPPKGFLDDEDDDDEETDDEPIPLPLAIDEDPDQTSDAENVIPFSLADGPPPPPPEEIPPTIWDEIFALLTITTSDREQLKRKRGFSKETIELAGYRSSIKENRKLLAPILEKYPAGLLLSLGIASKDQETQEVKINAQLCGLGLKKRGDKLEDDEWDWVNPILIPYRDHNGKVISIRPHKGGLSGKRFMQEQGYERAFRSTRTRTLPYTNFLFFNRPDKWQRSCVLTEGEHKANALGQCGIPAMAVPGIQMPKNKIFLEEMIEILRTAGIRDIIVCYDNEDKSHKPDPWMRYEAEVWADYACDILRTCGFNTSFAMLPDEWRIDGKADWDGALAQFGTGAAAKFAAVLKKAKHYHPQTELFGVNEKDRIKHCKLNRLKIEPTILTGGEEEEDLAKLILKTKDPYRLPLQVRDLAKELFETRGCYYVRKKLDLKALREYFKIRAEIKEKLEEVLPEDLESIASLEAALAAVNHIIAGRPDILSDFTISCDFQIRTQSGVIHKLFRFKNKHGQLSGYVTVPPSACSTSTKFREFCMGVGNFNPMIGDKQLQQLMIDIGVFSAWREIRELEMLGRDPESNLWIMGDCAFTPDADLFNPDSKDAIFADKHDILWWDGIGYRIDPDDLKEFGHLLPPKFFQAYGKTPAEVYSEIKADPKKERMEVGITFLQFAADMIATFGDVSGLLALGAMLSYAMAPELLAKYHGQPGLWIHGRAFAGKSETSRFLMMLWGFDSGYRTFVLSSGTTAVAIDRFLSQYSDMPAHADEFRQDEADKNRIASLRTPYNRQSKAKGKMDQSNKTRSVQPRTSPLVTGEGVTNDSATLSRYIEAILAADKRLGTKEEQIRRYERMLADCDKYHRIIRYVLLNRKWFGAAAMKTLDEFVSDNSVAERIKGDRLRLNYGTAFAAVHTLMDHFIAALNEAKESGTMTTLPIAKPDMILLQQHISNLRESTVSYARNAAQDVASINMVVRFWTDVMTAFGRKHEMRKFIFFSRCTIDAETNRVTRLNQDFDQEGIVRCVIVRPNELYAEYEADARQRGQEPALSLSNIRSQCQHERYWVPAPTNQARQAHRMTIDELGQCNVWVLRCDRMDPTLENLFSEQFEKNMKPEEPMLEAFSTK